MGQFQPLRVVTLLALILSAPTLAQAPVGTEMLAAPLADAPAIVLLENQTLEPVRIDRLLVLIEADGDIRRGEMHRADVTLHPGASHMHPVDLPGLLLDEGETLRFEALTVATARAADPATRRAEALDALLAERRRLGGEPPDYPAAELLEAQGGQAGLDALEEGRLQLDDDGSRLTGLQACMVFCYDCSILATRACTTGLRSVNCSCSPANCRFECFAP